MSRPPNWAEALDAYLVEMRERKFQYGAHDCVTFARGAFKAVTGRDLDLPRWATRREADALLTMAGGLEAAVDGVLPRKPIGIAARGDVGLADTPEGPTLFVVAGSSLVGPGPDGLVFWPRAALRVAWAVD